MFDFYYFLTYVCVCVFITKKGEEEKEKGKEKKEWRDAARLEWGQILLRENIEQESSSEILREDNKKN